MRIAVRFWISLCVGFALTELVSAANETRYYANQMELVFNDQTVETCIQVDFNLTAVIEAIHQATNRTLKTLSEIDAKNVRELVDEYVSSVNRRLLRFGCRETYFWEYDFFGWQLEDFAPRIRAYKGTEEILTNARFLNLMTSRRRESILTVYNYGSEFFRDGDLRAESRVKTIECTKDRFLFKVCATDIQMSAVQSIYEHYGTISDGSEQYNPWLPIPNYRGLDYVARINNSLMFVQIGQCWNIHDTLFKCARPPADQDSLPLPLKRCHFQQLKEDAKFRLDCEVPLGGDAKAIIQTEHKWPVEAQALSSKNLTVAVPEDLFGLKMGSFARVLDLPAGPKVVAPNRTLLEEITEVDIRQHQSEPISEPTSQTEDTFTLQLILEAILVLSMTLNLTFCVIIWCLRRQAPARKDANSSFANCNYFD